MEYWFYLWLIGAISAVISSTIGVFVKGPPDPVDLLAVICLALLWPVIVGLALFRVTCSYWSTRT